MVNQDAKTATVQFVSSPTGAEVYLDNQYRGSTPATVTGIEPGNHALEFRRTGYVSWSDTATIPPGTSQFAAALSPAPGAQQGVLVPSQTATQRIVTPARGITARVSKDLIVIGDSMTFSGTSSGITRIILMLYGPGYYNNGVQLDEVRPDNLGLWSYTWNPGTKLLPGSFTIEARDDRNTVSDKASFRAVGNGVVSVTPNKYAAAPGDTIIFSGQCTTGADNVRLVLNGPGGYSGGVELGTISVAGTTMWSFTYKLDPNMPAGSYTIAAYDIPKTTSGTSQFTVGFVSIT